MSVCIVIRLFLRLIGLFVHSQKWWNVYKTIASHVWKDVLHLLHFFIPQNSILKLIDRIILSNIIPSPFFIKSKQMIILWYNKYHWIKGKWVSDCVSLCFSKMSWLMMWKCLCTHIYVKEKKSQTCHMVLQESEADRHQDGQSVSDTDHEFTTQAS